MNNIFITQADREIARNIALKNIAKFFGIKSWAYETNENLKQEIEKKPEANNIIKLINIYFTAYDGWFNFYQDKQAIEKEQKIDYKLNTIEQNQLQLLISRRVSTMIDLQNEFNRLQKINEIEDCMMYIHYKISVGEKTKDFKNNLRNIKSMFLIDGLDVVDYGNDSYDIIKKQNLYSFGITILDRENTFLNTYIQDTIKHFDITEYTEHQITEQEYSNMKNPRFKEVVEKISLE